MGEQQRARRQEGSVSMTISVRDLPETLWEIRRELSRIVRDVAGSESDPRVTRRLNEIAAEFEAGQ